MYQKNFVSIYFSSDQIQIVKLNSNKSAVVKASSFAVPQGVIANHKVENVQLLADALKNIWKQMKIKEKFVGIIVPEFSTFTKTMTLPSLENAELDEAVRWQAGEILPFEKGNEILDWKIIHPQATGNVVLVSAISKDVLTGYVDAVSQAGLYPQSVETPSLSLARVIDGSAVKRLVIYQGNSETILLITSGQSIIGSSVVGSKDEHSVLYTAWQVVHHYAEGTVEEVFVSGQHYSQNFYTQLQQNTGNVPLKKASLPVQGLSPDQLQEYLVPISLQMQDPRSPDDALSINLLPPAWAKKYHDQYLTRQSWRLSIIANMLVFFNILALVGAFVVMQAQLSATRASSDPSIVVDQSVVDRVSSANALIKSLSTIAEMELYPQNMLNILSEDQQAGISVTSYFVDIENGEARVQGLALLRNDLISYREQLEQSGMFDVVEIPISTLVQEENVEFSVRLQKELKPVKKNTPKLQL